ncbi:hypothetical protein [Nonomuraea phyllanthi]|nr:hypothetical protein [Nonomuraea phyllanthi]
MVSLPDTPSLMCGRDVSVRGYLAKETRRFADPVLRGEITGFHRELVD